MSDLDFSDAPARRRRPDNTGWKYLAVVLGVVLVLGLGGLAVMRQARSGPMSREQFEGMVIGKTQQEVLDKIGHPHQITEFSPGRESWSYRQITHHPVTKTADFDSSILFVNGRATSVDY